MKGRSAAPPAGAGAVDLTTAREVARDCGWTLRELAEFYLEGTERQLEALETAIEGRASGEARRLAHGSAGASATCGMRALERLLKQIEDAALGSRLGEAAELLAETRRRLAQAKRILERAAERESDA